MHISECFALVGIAALCCLFAPAKKSATAANKIVYSSNSKAGKYLVKPWLYILFNYNKQSKESIKDFFEKPCRVFYK